MTEVPAIVRAGDLPPAVRILLQLAENEQREDLTLLERARAYRRALEASGLEMAAFADQSRIGRSLLSRYLWVARSEGLVGEALGADLLRHLETARLYSRLPADQQLRLLRAAQRTGEPITLSKVQRAQAAAEAHLPPDPADFGELPGDPGPDQPAGDSAAGSSHQAASRRPAAPPPDRGSTSPSPAPEEPRYTVSFHHLDPHLPAATAGPHATAGPERGSAHAERTARRDPLTLFFFWEIVECHSDRAAPE